MTNDETAATAEPVTRPMFTSIGKPIAPPLVRGVVVMALGSIIGVFLGGEAGVLFGGVISLAGIVMIVIGIARLADAVQYLAMRERDREHDDDVVD